MFLGTGGPRERWDGTRHQEQQIHSVINIELLLASKMNNMFTTSTSWSYLRILGLLPENTQALRRHSNRPTDFKVKWATVGQIVERPQGMSGKSSPGVM